MSDATAFVADYFEQKKVNGSPVYKVYQNVLAPGLTSEKQATGFEIIDVLVIGREEVYIVKTQSNFPFKGSLSKSTALLKIYFNQAETFVRKEYDSKDKKIKKLFVTDNLSFIFF